MKNKIIYFIVIFLFWRFLLFTAGLAADKVVKYEPSFPNVQQLKQSQTIRAIYSWGNFDGVHYLTIAEKGYVGTGLIQAFFPGYPLTIKLINIFLSNLLVSGLLVSNLFFFFDLIVFYKLVKLDWSNKTANFSIIFLLLFPTSFFFVGLYSESIFLFFVLMSFYFARKKRWGWASTFVALASFTRIIGVFLVPALLVELWLQNNSQNLQTMLQRNWQKLVIILLGSTGLIAYMTYLKYTFDDPLFFYHLQSEFGAGRQESIILLPQVIWRYLKIMATARPIDFKYLSYVQEFVYSLFALSALLLSIKKIRFSYLIFSIFAWILPTLTGTFSSMPRYILVCFPIYIWLALFAGKLWNRISGKIFIIHCLVALSTLLCLNLILFLQGHWVA
ncbi:MAG: hypothetical protein ACOZAN_02355 [Patescibacteria group bacterium]